LGVVDGLEALVRQGAASFRLWTGLEPPIDVMRRALGERFYQVYFQEPGVAERELERDVRRTVTALLYGASGDSPAVPDMMVGEDGLVGVLPLPDRLPGWLTEADVDHFTAEFERTGFRGGLNWYRTQNLSWELSAPWQGALVTPPALFMVGDRDVVYHFPGGPETVAALKSSVPDLRQSVVLEGCGHWIQQERPREVNEALLDFLRQL